MFKPLTNIKRHRYYCLVCIILFAACASRPIVPVVERKVVTVPEQTELIGGNLVRVVQPGDTLYSIAFAAGISVNNLAAWNRVNHNYQIDVGQKLRLTKPIGLVAEYPVKGTGAKVKASTQTNDARWHVVETPKKPVVNSALPQWGWPTKGKVIRNFYPAVGRKGIDILGGKGQSIVAANDGTVVYVGNGLRGYGNLIIIKHSQSFLSAYANNKSILIAQGDTIKRGAKIAEMGRNESGQYVLHFQIRKKGKPVNPKSFLLIN